MSGEKSAISNTAMIVIVAMVVLSFTIPITAIVLWEKLAELQNNSPVVFLLVLIFGGFIILAIGIFVKRLFAKIKNARN